MPGPVCSVSLARLDAPPASTFRAPLAFGSNALRRLRILELFFVLFLSSSHAGQLNRHAARRGTRAPANAKTEPNWYYR